MFYMTPSKDDNRGQGWVYWEGSHMSPLLLTNASLNFTKVSLTVYKRKKKTSFVIIAMWGFGVTTGCCEIYDDK